MNHQSVKIYDQFELICDESFQMDDQSMLFNDESMLIDH